MSWADRAACIGRSTPTPTLTGVAGDCRQNAARVYCAGCPVTAQCAADALKCGDIGVVRGGVYIAFSGGFPTRTSRKRLAAAAAPE